MAQLLKRTTVARSVAASARISTPRLFHVAAARYAARTGLYDFHVQNEAKIVPFGGYDMPLSYGKVGQVASHKHVREHAGLFDVGHMVQHKFTGPTAAAFLQRITPASLTSMAPFNSTLSVLLSPEGGILDDLIITKHADDDFYVVTNAGCREDDLKYIAEQLEAFGKDNEAPKHEVLENQGLVALQGPSAAGVLAKLLPADFDLSKLVFGQSAFVSLSLPGGETVECHVARGGYTGEDGFEISIPPASTEAVAKALLADAEVELAGLAARDSLRLEAGMCLYGHDLDPSVSPVEGALAWTVAKDRRAAADFLGAERVLRELKEGPPRRCIGLLVEAGAPARGTYPQLTTEGSKIYAEDGTTEIGQVTSGIPSPTLGKNIAMALVKNGYHKRDTPVKVSVRNKLRDATVARMPFVPSKFYRG